MKDYTIELFIIFEIFWLLFNTVSCPFPACAKADFACLGILESVGEVHAPDRTV
jgi:hypothetical protein